jgi:DNA-binding NarL/FixJ family response regulator
MVGSIKDAPPAPPLGARSRRSEGVAVGELAADGRSSDRLDLVARVRRLTERERQVALLVAEGLKDVVIARRLGLSASTVAAYVRNIKQRLKLDTRAEITAWVTARLDPPRAAGRHPDVQVS